MKLIVKLSHETRTLEHVKSVTVEMDENSNAEGLHVTTQRADNGGGTLLIEED